MTEAVQRRPRPDRASTPTPVPSTWIPPASISVRAETDFHLLLWQARGEADVDVDGADLVLRVGQALWVPVGTRHGFTVRAGSVTMPLFFDAARTADPLPRPTVVHPDDDLRTLMLAHVVSSSTALKVPADLGRQILQRIGGESGRGSALPLPRTAAARVIAETLRTDPGDPRGVEELAASVHTTARTIERVFRAETGLTLRQWRIRTRLQAAQALLRTGLAPDAVAHRVGYTHVNSFRRVFTEHLGVSPSAYLRAHARR